MSQELPKYIAVQGLCKVLNGDRKPEEWRPRRVASILRSMGILRKYGHYLVFTPEDLAGAWPEAYEELLGKLAEVKPYVRKQPARAAKLANKRSVSNQTRVKTDTTTTPTYDYDANPCSYEVGGGWSCGPECEEPSHKL